MTERNWSLIDAQGNPRMFADPTAALADFRQPYPGEGGQRNELRGPGFFDIDAGIDKHQKNWRRFPMATNWSLAERHPRAEFETRVKQLRLTLETYAYSRELAV